LAAPLPTIQGRVGLTIGVGETFYPGS